jgi:hypothetical protein
MVVLEKTRDRIISLLPLRYNRSPWLGHMNSSSISAEGRVDEDFLTHRTTRAIGKRTALAHGKLERTR